MERPKWKEKMERNKLRVIDGEIQGGKCMRKSTEKRSMKITKGREI